MKNAPKAYKTEVKCSLALGKNLRENSYEKITTRSNEKILSEPLETRAIKLATEDNP